MKKVLFILGLLIITSCEDNKNDDCECYSVTYDVVDSLNEFGLPVSELVEVSRTYVGCEDESATFNEDTVVKVICNQ